MPLNTEHEIARCRVLLVERESDYALMLREKIESEGAELVGCVKSGIEAVSFVRHSDVDAVVLDVQTLAMIPFRFDTVMSTFGIDVITVASMDAWFDVDDVDANDESAVDPDVEMPTILVPTKDRSRVRLAPYALTISERRPWSLAD